MCGQAGERETELELKLYLVLILFQYYSKKHEKKIRFSTLALM